jgi:penicillin amidase
MSNITPEDMMNLQNDNYDVFAEQLRPVLTGHVERTLLSDEAASYLKKLEDWDLNRNIAEVGPTIFDHWVDSLSMAIFSDELERNQLPTMYPKDYILAQYLTRDSITFKFIDNIQTPETETLKGLLTTTLEKATLQLRKLEDEGKLSWGQFKNTTIYHLLRTSMLPFARAGLQIGGGENIINATKHSHGPSWKMVIHLTTPTEAWGIYPGGQEGNPGSRFYDNTANDWAKGAYYKLWVMRPEERNDPRIKGKMIFKR